MRFGLALCFAVMTVPALAQDSPAPETPPAFMDQVEGLMQKFLERIAPQMEQGLNALEPDLQALMDRMRDMVQFHPPEVLHNGDILIRRRQPTDQPPSMDAPDGDDPVVTPFEL